MRYMEMVKTLMASMMKPITLTVHGNPILGRSCCTITEMTTPPVHDPNEARPTASARRRAKYVVRSDMAGQNCSPLAIPLQIACAKNSCQKFVALAVLKMPRIWKAAPGMYTHRKRPASSARPLKVPMKKRRKICTLPIQEMVEGDTPRDDS